MSLLPLYDKNVNLVAWLDKERKHIFSTKMVWVAFISEGNIFSSDGSRWLGPLKTTNCLDRNGKPVLWNPNNKVTGSSKPHRPYTPYRPYRPYTPYTPYTPYRPYTPYIPSGGWSDLNYNEWLSQ